MITIIHETSPLIAYDIVQKGMFWGGPIAGDGGLNAYIKGKPGYHPDQAENRGALLEFEWSGTIEKGSQYGLIGSPNVLYDQHPHRAILFVGTTKYLHLTLVSLKDGYSYEDVVPANHLTWIPDWLVPLSSLRNYWIRKQLKNIETEIRQRLLSKPNIQIVRPPNCIY